MKERIDKLDYVKMKNLGENIAKDISDRGLLLKIHKELLKLNNKKNKDHDLKNGPKTLTPRERK